jgi:hypothetical protein
MGGGVLTFSADPPIKRVLVELRTKSVILRCHKNVGGVRMRLTIKLLLSVQQLQLLRLRVYARSNSEDLFRLGSRIRYCPCFNLTVFEPVITGN